LLGARHVHGVLLGVRATSGTLIGLRILGLGFRIKVWNTGFEIQALEFRGLVGV
jgi:hypothetical protein